MSVFTNNIESAAIESAAYIDAVLELLGDRDPVRVLRETPEWLRHATAGLSDAELHRPEAPGKWSMLAVVQHLADSELVWAYRLRMVVAHERPEITGYDQDAWAERLRYDEARREPALAMIETLREANLRLIDSLDEAERRRAGIHSERGEESIDHMVRLYAGHDLVHRRQLERIRHSLW